MATLHVDKPDLGDTESLDFGKGRDQGRTSPHWLGKSTSDRNFLFLEADFRRVEQDLGHAERTEIPSLEISQPDFGRLSPLVGLPFEIPDQRSVASYLRNHPDAKNALRHTYRALRTLFFDEPLRLEVYRDPEGEVGPKLAIYVETSEAPEEALSKLDKFDETFWLDHLDEYDTYLCINISYQ